MGFWVGRTVGPRLQRSGLARRVGHERWAKANMLLRTKGGRAVFIGRFIGVLRALLPVIAGQSGMAYGRFLPLNAAGGILWSSAFILLGVGAGSSWHTVERWTGRASFVLLAILVGALGIFLAARWVSGHLHLIQAKRRELMEHPPMVAVRRRFRSQIDFVKRRLDTGQRFGLYLTVGLALSLVGGLLFAEIFDDVVSNEEIALLDKPTMLFLVRNREQWLNDGMRTVTLLGGTGFVAAVFGIAAVWVYVKTRLTRWPAFLAVAMVGGLGLDNILKHIVGRPRPNIQPLVEASGSSFPSGHATAAAALFSALAFVLTRRRPWRSSVWIWAAAFSLALLVGLSRVYLGVHWPTDVMAGVALGLFWTTVAATATAAWPRSQGGEGAAGWG